MFFFNVYHFPELQTLWVLASGAKYLARPLTRLICLLWGRSWIIIIFRLLVQHRASVKSFQALRSPAITLTSFHGSSCVSYFVLYCPLPRSFRPTSSSISLRIPTPMRFSLLLLLLYVMCVKSNSIPFFLFGFLLVSAWWFSIVLHL